MTYEQIFIKILEKEEDENYSEAVEVEKIKQSESIDYLENPNFDQTNLPKSPDNNKINDISDINRLPAKIRKTIRQNSSIIAMQNQAKKLNKNLIKLYKIFKKLKNYRFCICLGFLAIFLIFGITFIFLFSLQLVHLGDCNLHTENRYDLKGTYHRNGLRCVKNNCICVHGRADITRCFKNNDRKCLYCDHMYKLTFDEKCVCRYDSPDLSYLCEHDRVFNADLEFHRHNEY